MIIYEQFDADFDDAETTGSGGEAPVGEYQCEIKKFLEGETQSGISRLTCVLEVVSGEHAGKTVFKNWLITKSSVPFIKADFMTLGLPITKYKFSQLRRMLDTDIVGKWCQVVKKQKPDSQYANVYINSMVDVIDTPKDHYSDAKEIAATTSDDDIPF